MISTSSLPDNDPHAYPSVYEPDAPSPAPVPPSAAADGGEAAPPQEEAVGEKGFALDSIMSAARLARPKARAHGSSTPSASALPTQSLAHPKELDLFPAFMSRSALFGTFRSGCGGAHAGPLQAAGEVSLTFNGPRLSMADKRVWEALARIAKRSGFDIAHPFNVRMAEVAKLAGFRHGQTRSAWASVERLTQSRIDAIVYGARISGWLVTSVVANGRDAAVRLDPGLVEPAFFKTLLASMAGAAGDGVESLLAQWLRDYLSTHKPPAIPLTLDYLRGLSGYLPAPKRFIGALEKAMQELAAKRPDLIASWSIDKSTGSDNASDQWSLLAVRGPAMPVVKHPPKPVPPSAPKVALAPKRRGGVSL